MDSRQPTGERVEFRSGSLTLWARRWLPAGQGPFPTVLWNHGSQGRYRGLQAPRGEGPTVLETWLDMGLAVFAASRRGYDGADGIGWKDAVATAEDGTPRKGRLLCERLMIESDDVLSAAEHLKTEPWADSTRLVCAGYSFGGIMTMLGLARSAHFAAGVNFASAAIMWPIYPAIRDLVLAQAATVQRPLMVIQAKNDYCLEPTSAIARVLEQRGIPHRAVVYPALGQGPEDGHAFCALGGRLWGPDVRAFLADFGVLVN